MAKTVFNNTGILALIDILVIFIKQEQFKVKSVENICNKYQKDNNPSWVKNILCKFIIL